MKRISMSTPFFLKMPASSASFSGWKPVQPLMPRMTFSCAWDGKASSAAASNANSLMGPLFCSTGYCIVSVVKTLRVDHVGSLLRPEYLKDAFKRYAVREISHHELRATQDRAIREVVRRQESIGLPVITDGEYRRLNWQVSFSEVEGWDMWRTSWDHFERNPENRAPGETPLTKGEDAVLSFHTPVTARLSLKRNFPL